MPSSLTHGMLAVAIGCAVVPKPLLKPVLAVGVACAVLPDVDAIGRLWSSGDVEFLGGHRGFTHSLTFAVLLGTLCGVATLPFSRWRGVRLRFAVYIAIATAAHGVLDAFTTIGASTSPPQFFSPFSTTGHVSPWLPITGPFSELFYLLAPLLGVTRWIIYVRNLQWLRRAREPLLALDLRRDRVSTQTLLNTSRPEGP